MWQCLRGLVLSIFLLRIPYANNAAGSEPTSAENYQPNGNTGHVCRLTPHPGGFTL
ncbi:hypothetical protein GGI35DRAFT_443022 [Trichoderma velutinum]